MFEQQCGVGLITIGRGNQELTHPRKGIIRIEHLRTIQRLVRQIDIAVVRIQQPKVDPRTSALRVDFNRPDIRVLRRLGVRQEVRISQRSPVHGVPDIELERLFQKLNRFFLRRGGVYCGQHLRRPRLQRDC